MSIEDASAAAAAAQEAANAAAATASAAATANWPIGGYNTFIPLLFIYMSAVLAICVDLSTVYLVHDNIVKYQYVLSTIYVMLMIYSWISLIEKLLIFTTVSSILGRETGRVLDNQRLSPSPSTPNN